MLCTECNVNRVCVCVLVKLEKRKRNLDSKMILLLAAISYVVAFGNV